MITFCAEVARHRARVRGAVVARLALAVRVVVDLDAGRVRVERAARRPVETLLAELLRWNVHSCWDC